MTTDTHRWLTLPGAPDIPGLRFRTYTGPEDTPAMADLYAAVAEADGDPERWTAEELRVELENWTHFDPREDDVLAFVDGELVASSRLDWVDSNDGRRFYYHFGRVRPTWRRRGLGSAMWTRNERRLIEAATEHEDPRPRVLATYTEENDVGDRVLAETHGYGPVRVYHLMVRPDMEDILMPPLPDGLEVRPVTPDLLPQLFEAMAEAFKDHFGGDDTSPPAYRRWVEDPNLDPSLWSVAFDGDEIAAGVLGYVFPAENEAHGYARGWPDPVFTRRAWRRRGLASALIGRTLVLLRDRGMTSAQLGVDSENPNQALGLYQRHGFVVQRSSTEWHKPLGS